MNDNRALIEANLMAVLAEVGRQADVGHSFPAERLSFAAQVEQIREWIEDANECGIAYELLVSTLEQFPFQVSGPTVVKLLEVALLLRYKTDLAEDAQFDSSRVMKNALSRPSRKG